MEDFQIYAILASMLVSIFALVGIFVLVLKKSLVNKISLLLVSLAVGTLLGDVFIHILPELPEQGLSLENVGLSMLGSILLFTIIEKFLHWRHSHVEIDEKHIHPIAITNLIGDGIHNLLDGMVIGASFSVSTEIGVATTIAVLLHEIPQELGDFGVLVHSGVKPKKALFFNLIFASLAIFGTVLALVIGTQSEEIAAYLLAFAGGSFLYIALADLIPVLKENLNWKSSLLQFFAILIGVLAMFGLTFFESHDHEEDYHIHAGFHIYKNGEKMDFSGFEFMDFGACSTDEHDEDDEHEEHGFEDIKDFIHLHDSKGNIVHIHKSGARWSDLLEDLRLNYEEDKIKVFSDGKEIDAHVIDSEIRDLQSLVFVLDQNESVDLDFVSVDEIEEAALFGESCSL